jgi:hypothetical protein
MSSVIIAGDTSGTITLAAPAVSGTTTLTLPATTDTLVGKTTTDTLTNKTLTSPTITGATITVASTAAPAFSANLSTSTTVSTSTYVKVPFNSEVTDTNSNYDPTTNYRFTPTVAGYYQINLYVLSSAATTQVSVIYKNGNQFTGGTCGALVSGIGTGTTSSGLISMNGTTDYVEGYVYQTVSGSIAGGVGGCNFSGFLARSA